MLLGSVLQSSDLFLLLAGVLAWGTIAIKQNVFDAIYNYAVAFPRGFPPLGAAPPPRRFAQGSAAILALATGIGRLSGATIAARILEGVFVVGVGSAVLRRFCLPAHLYFLLRSKLAPIFGFTADVASQRC